MTALPRVLTAGAVVVAADAVAAAILAAAAATIGAPPPRIAVRAAPDDLVSGAVLIGATPP